MKYSQFEIMRMARAAAEAVRKKERGMNASQLAAVFEREETDPLLEKALDEAVRSALLIVRKEIFYTPRQLRMVRGTLSVNPRGFGFVSDLEGEDLFLPPGAVEGAMHGDTVLCRILPPRTQGKGPEGHIEKILERNTEYVTGRVRKGYGTTLWLTPDDARLGTVDYYIEKGSPVPVREGDHAVMRIRSYSRGGQPVYGTVCEILEDAEGFGADITAILRTHGIFEEFPQEVQRQAERLEKAGVGEEDLKGREDFRNLFTVTIDGRDSKDFDDAVSIEMPDEEHLRLYVHIADVSHYVTENSPLDREALKRGTSVYLPDRVCPMLPEALSNGICSLNEGQDRLCLTVIADFDRHGRTVGTEICRGVIRVDHRLVYDDVNVLFEEGKNLFDAQTKEELLRMRDLAAKLNTKRIGRGNIDFTIPECSIVLDEKGNVKDVQARETGEANRMIEEFMLIANEAVASYLDMLELPAVYRVHEEPEKEKTLEFIRYLSLFGYRFPPFKGEVTPKHFQKVAEMIRDTDEEYAISRLMLRSMQKARYSQEDLGHFGLALKQYCHFTSPIRRYPDLVVHRVLNLHLQGQINESNYARLSAAMPEIAEQCSARERTAMEAERAADDLMKCVYMQQFLGEEFDAIISGVTSFGFYAELDNTVEGLVRTTALQDHFLYDEKRMQLVNSRTRKVYKTGDYVRVAVAGVDMQNRKIDFSLHTRSR